MGIVSKLTNAMGTFGFVPLKFGRSLRGIPRFIGDCRRYSKLSRGSSMPFSLRGVKPILYDYYDSAGVAGGHYFHQDIWAAKKIHQARPARHVDIASRVDGFISHLLVFMPVEVIDIRPLQSNVSGLSFIQSDATNLSNIADDSIESLSTLHAIEHFGLGRYTDPIDPSACYAAMDALARVLKPGGRLYFSTPVGRQRVEFNAQRVFSPTDLIARFHRLKLVSFACVNDDGHFDDSVRPEQLENARYSCGLYEFTK
jgi:hypothetical protein